MCSVVALSTLDSLFISRNVMFMDVYLDDIIIYSDSIEDVKHIRMIFQTLHRAQLYLTKKVLQVLGRIIDNNGIHMEPSKVDKVLNWKVLTN